MPVPGERVARELHHYTSLLQFACEVLIRLGAGWDSLGATLDAVVGTSRRARYVLPKAQSPTNK